MIQVCSQCGTRWNVRDRQRVWCPRCNGALMAPRQCTGPALGSTRHEPPADTPAHARPATRRGCRGDSAGSRCAPDRRRHRGAVAGPSGPTPRYLSIPRWGLVDQIAPQAALERVGDQAGRLARRRFARRCCRRRRSSDSPPLIHIVRYVLLLINRTSLLPPLVAGAALWLGVLAEPRGDRVGDPDRRGPHVVADRAPFGGVPLPRARGPATGVGAVGRLPGAGRQPGVGAGVRHRTGTRRGVAGAAARADHRLVDRLGVLHRRLDLRVSRPASPPSRRASPTTR